MALFFLPRSLPLLLEAHCLHMLTNLILRLMWCVRHLPPISPLLSLTWESCNHARMYASLGQAAATLLPMCRYQHQEAKKICYLGQCPPSCFPLWHSYSASRLPCTTLPQHWLLLAYRPRSHVRHPLLTGDSHSFPTLSSMGLRCFIA